jgi:hypothetical protein
MFWNFVNSEEDEVQSRGIREGYEYGGFHSGGRHELIIVDGIECL